MNLVETKNLFNPIYKNLAVSYESLCFSTCIASSHNFLQIALKEKKQDPFLLARIHFFTNIPKVLKLFLLLEDLAKKWIALSRCNTSSGFMG